MSHKQAAEYHRGEATKEFNAQGRSGMSDAGYASSRASQMNHTEAAHRADAAFAKETGQTVVYTPLGVPVFRK
jgi:hypothetical protein